MDLRRWEEIQAAFDALVELDPTARARRLETLDATDPAFRATVAALDKISRNRTWRDTEDTDAWTHDAGKRHRHRVECCFAGTVSDAAARSSDGFFGIAIADQQALGPPLAVGP